MSLNLDTGVHRFDFRTNIKASEYISNYLIAYLDYILHVAMFVPQVWNFFCTSIFEFVYTYSAFHF